MRNSVKKGFSFGLTSGTITTLGLIVGLHSGTNSKIVIIGGILVIAIADAMSDALGIHVSEESENHHSTKEIWEATLATFIAKFFFALTFVLPIIFLNLTPAIIISIIWGLFTITLISYKLALDQRAKPAHIIFEHVLIAVIVIIVTHFIGDWIATLN